MLKGGAVCCARAPALAKPMSMPTHAIGSEYWPAKTTWSIWTELLDRSIFFFYQCRRTVVDTEKGHYGITAIQSLDYIKRDY